MVEVINGVKNIKKLCIGKGLKSTPITNKGSGLQPVIKKENIKKKYRKRLENSTIKNKKILLYNI